MIPFPNKKYNIIYADPAWSYGGGLPQRAPVQHYQTMPHDVMINMPVKDIAATIMNDISKNRSVINMLQI